MSNEIKKRIQHLIQELRLSERQFSFSIGKSESFVRTMNDNLGSDAVCRILKIYPSVNPYWLLLGEGDMYVNANIEKKLRTSTEDYVESLKVQIKQLKEIIKSKDELISVLKNSK